MALVKCAECNSVVSIKASTCPYCGYTPKRSCRNCQGFDWTESFCSGRCYATEKDVAKEYKGVRPAVIKKSVFNADFLSCHRGEWKI